MNKVILIGNLTRDPELSQTSAGIPFCKFAIAVTRSYTNSNGEREADFFNVVCWRQTAENVAKYLVKGRKVGIWGSIQTRTYDAQDGTRRYAIDIAADEVEFLSPNPNAQGGSGYSAPAGEGSYNKAASKGNDEMIPVNDDELPF